MNMHDLPGSIETASNHQLVIAGKTYGSQCATRFARAAMPGWPVAGRGALQPPLHHLLRG